MPLQLLEDFTIRTAAISGSVDINTGTMHHIYTAVTEALHKYYTTGKIPCHDPFRNLTVKALEIISND